MSAIVPHPADAEAEIAGGLPSRFAGSAFAPVRSPDGAQRNPGAAQAACTAPDFAFIRATAIQCYALRRPSHFSLRSPRNRILQGFHPGRGLHMDRRKLLKVLA